ncbi:MAG: GerMN domain-containing protein [Deltaproteobacteria bacterium]
MKRKGRKEGQKKTRKKSRRRGVFILAVLIGIGIGAFLLFRQEGVNIFKPEVTKRSVSREQKNVILYFSDEEGEYLIGERDKITKRDRVEEEAKELLTELIRGPKGKLIPTLPSQTRLLTLHVDEKGVAKVSFSKAFTADHPGGSSAEIMTVYSIVNSLTTNFPQIKRVQILIEGKEIESIAGHLSLMRPISSKPDLIRK